MLDSSKLVRVSVAMLTAGLMALGSPVAFAHDVVMKANPADKSTVSEFPRTIELEFSGVPKDSFNTVAVSNQDTGEVLFTENPTPQEQWIRVAVPESVQPGAGSYKVGFQITSSDGHATRGMTSFQVSGASTSNASTASETGEAAGETSEPFVASSSESPVSNNTYLFIALGIGALLVVAVVGAIYMLTTRNSRKK